MKFYILDERDAWHESIADSALTWGFDPARIRRGHEVKTPGWGFIRPHSNPIRLSENQKDWISMEKNLCMVQDEAQIRVYENKSKQWQRWGHLMPATWRFTDRSSARKFALSRNDFPVVSKSDVGASSLNVRIISDLGELSRHIDDAFGRGIVVEHCDSRGTKSRQRGYVLIQEFVPHDVTYRVNAVGSGRAIFRRYNYPDRPVAQTGNVEPVVEICDDIQSLLSFADDVFREIGTRWCAIDVLRQGDDWRLLETSLAWPWPSPGDCNSAPIFRTDYRWGDLFDCMFCGIIRGDFGGDEVVAR